MTQLFSLLIYLTYGQRAMLIYFLFIYLFVNQKRDTDQYPTQHEQDKKARKNRNQQLTYYTTKNQYTIKQYY